MELVYLVSEIVQGIEYHPIVWFFLQKGPTDVTIQIIWKLPWNVFAYGKGLIHSQSAPQTINNLEPEDHQNY